MSGSPSSDRTVASAATGFDHLAADLASLFARGGEGRLASATFDEWALRVFRWQFAHSVPFRGYCAGRGVTPGTVMRWEDVPPVPTGAFKRLRLLSVEQGREPEAVFRTSGTTGGARLRGEHPLASLELYRATLLPAFRAHVLPDGARPTVLSLIPSPHLQRDSSLSWMIGAVMGDIDSPGSGWFAAADGALQEEALLAAARAAAADGRPVLIAATAFGLVLWLEALACAGARVRLPAGSRLLETGGFKGRVREVSREDLYESVRDRLGLPPERIVNEYGMTELLSQFYEPVLSRPWTSGTPPARRHHVAPPWVRTRVLDPASLAPSAPGDPGLLCHYDLANLGSVSCVLTEDLGVAVDGGFRLLGRIPGAEPRGCSLATEALLTAAEGG